MVWWEVEGSERGLSPSVWLGHLGSPGLGSIWGSQICAPGPGLCLTAFTTGFVGVVLALSTGILLASNLGWMRRAEGQAVSGWRVELVKEGVAAKKRRVQWDEGAAGVLWVDPREESIWYRSE